MRRVALCVVLAWLLAAPPARAAEVTVTADRKVLRYPAEAASRVEFRLRIRTGAQAESLLFDEREGEMLSPIQGRVRLEGPGQLTVHPVAVDPVCRDMIDLAGWTTYGIDWRWPSQGWAKQTVEMPANSESVLVVPAFASQYVPRPGTRYTIKVTVNDVPVAVPSLPFTGPEGTELSLAPVRGVASGPCRWAGRMPVRERSRAIVVKGRSRPVRSGRRVALRVGSPGDRRGRVLSRTVIGRDGRFAFRPWRPRKPGQYAYVVEFPAQGGLHADASEIRVFQIAESGP